MPVRAADRIGVIAFGQFRMQQILLQTAPCARHGAFEIQNDVIEIDDIDALADTPVLDIKP